MKLLWLLACLGVHSRYIRERRQVEGGAAPGIQARSAGFAIVDKYPETSNIILKKGTSVTFNCASPSTKEWYFCTWRHPSYSDPCLLPSKERSENCEGDGSTEWKTKGNYQLYNEMSRPLHVCSIRGEVGADEQITDEGQWGCRLQENDLTTFDTANFTVTYLKAPTVTLSIGARSKREVSTQQGLARSKRESLPALPNEEQLEPGATVDVTCESEGAIPAPTLQWFLGPHQVNFGSGEFRDNFELLEETDPIQSQDGTFSQRSKIRYTASEKHNKRSIFCQAYQVDDQEETQKTKSTRELSLYILSPPPDQEVLPMGVIISSICFIIVLVLAILFLLLAWKTKKFCFSSKIVVLPHEADPLICEGCISGTKQHNKNCSDMGTDADGIDPVNKISKYQTEIILVTDKLVDNPSSAKNKEEFDKWTRYLDSMVQGMASSETDEGLKNRFLMAAQGLTSSVDALLGAAEKSAASPHGEGERREARYAGEEVKSSVKQSVNTVRRIHAMKDLQKMVESAVSAIKETNNVATEVVETDPTSHDSLMEACGETARATEILEQALNFFIQNPTSARAQTNLLATARGFLKPADLCRERCEETHPQLAYEESQEKLKNSTEKFTNALDKLETTVKDTELCVDSLATEQAIEEIRALQLEMEEIRNEAAKGNLKLRPGESAQKAAEDTIQLCGSIRAAGADCLISSLAGDKQGMDKAARELLDALGVLNISVRAAAAGAQDKTAQDMVLNSGDAMLDQAVEVLSRARRTVLNPSNPLAAQKQVEASEGLSQGIVTSVLASSQEGNLKASLHVADDLNNELEQFRDALNAFRVKPIPGITLENVSNKLDTASNNVQKNVTDLIGSTKKGDEFGSEEAAHYVALALDDYKNAIRAVVSIMKDKEVQENILDKGQAILVGAAQLMKEADMLLTQPANTEAAKRLQNTASNLKASMKSLEQAYMYGAPGQEQFVSALNIMKNATKELQNPTPTEKREDIGLLKTRMMTATKEIAGLAHDIQTTAHTDPGEMDGLTSLAQRYKNLATDINQLMEQAEDAEEGQGTLDTVSGLGKSILHLIEGTAGHQVRPGQAALLQIADQAQAVAANSVKTLSSVNMLAKRAQAMDIIGKQLTGVLQNLDTTIMFASAGTLNVEDDSETFAVQREEILKYAQVLVTDVQAVLSGAASTKGELITASEQSLSNMQMLAEKTKGAASCLGPENQEAQVMLLNTAKDVCGCLVDLIYQAKTANGQDIGHPAYGQVKTLAKGVIGNITNLLKSVKTFEDESIRGTRAMESSVAAIGQELQLYRSGEGAVTEATPEELLRANRAITQATSRAVAAASSGKQEDLLAVANIGRRAIAELLQTVRGATQDCQDEELKSEILSKADLLAQQYQHLLQQVAAGADQETLVNLSRTVAQTATSLAQLAERLKGDGWVDHDNPMFIAETELLNAASSIEAAAEKLSKLTRRNDGPEKDLKNMTFNELIIDSAQSIAKATTSLIKAATEAQRELVAQGKVAAETEMGSEAGQWSEGLVSAAKMVASATRSLCEAANNLVTGEGSEEHLIAAAKAVSKSTAQLVLACKVKADGWETSSVMIGLNDASIAVRKATDALVKAARKSIDTGSKAAVKVDIYKEMIDADAKVIRLQKQVSEAKLVEEERKEQSQITGTVTDIKRARDAENEVQLRTKELEHAVNHKHRLNEKQYNTLPRQSTT